MTRARAGWPSGSRSIGLSNFGAWGHISQITRNVHCSTKDTKGLVTEALRSHALQCIMCRPSFALEAKGRRSLCGSQPVVTDE